MVQEYDTLQRRKLIVEVIDLERIKMGDITLSRVVQGYWRLTSWGWSPDALLRHMNECLKRGVTTFDTAAVYGGGECERQIGKALALDPSLRGRIELVTKVGIVPGDGVTSYSHYNTTYHHVISACKECLKRLGTEYADLLLIHREDPCMDPRECGRALKALKAEGLIRAYGVSNFDPWKFNALYHAVDGELVTNQIELNPVCFEHFDSGMMDLLADYGIHPMIWSPLAGGKLFTGKDDEILKVRSVLSELAEKYGTTESAVVYAWLTSHPVKALPVCGSNRIDRLEEALEGVETRLEHMDWYRIYTASGQKVLR